MSELAPTERLRKELGLMDVYAISTGAMFSSGFFLLPGLAAAQTGPSVALAYTVAGLFILPAMFSVAELATAMPRAGGAYYFLDRSLGPLVGTVGGLGTWLALVLKSAFALVGMGAYLALYFDVSIELLAVALTLVFAAINVLGAKETSGLQRVLVATLIAIITVFIVLGLVEIASRGITDVVGTRFTPFMPFGLTGFMATVGFVFVSYAGLTKVASVSEEVKAPERNIPLGMMLSLVTAAVAYGLGVFVIVALLPPDQLRDDLAPVASAAGALDYGGIVVLAVVVAAIAAFASTGNAGVLSASRYPLAMARDRLVPEWLGSLGRFRTPTASILATSILMIAAIVLLPIEGIAKLASAFQLLLFSLLNLAVVIMRESRIEAYDPGYRSPLYPWMQIVGFVAPFWLIAEMGQMAILFTLGLVAATIGWYFHYAAPRVERAGAIFHTFARLGEMRHGGLDRELRGIAQEQALREGDDFDQVVARAAVLDFRERVPLDDLLEQASTRLAAPTSVPPTVLAARFREDFDSGFLPVSRIAALTHVRIPGLSEPAMALARCLHGIRAPGGPAGAGHPLATISVVLFLASPREDPGRHLRLLGHIATRLAEPGFAERWLAAPGEAALRATLLGDTRLVRLLVASGLATARWIGRPLHELDLPEDLLVALVHRGGHDIVPRGATVIHAGDWLSLIGQEAAIRELEAIFEGKEPAAAATPDPSVTG